MKEEYTSWEYFKEDTPINITMVVMFHLALITVMTVCVEKAMQLLATTYLDIYTYIKG